MKKAIRITIAFIIILTLITSTLVSAFASVDDMRNAYYAGQYEQAIAEADKILAKDDAYMDAYYTKAMSYFYLGDMQKAYDTLVAQLKLNPKNMLALYNAACAASVLNLQNEALDLLERLLIVDITKKSAVKNDSDFDNIRETDKYKKLMEISVIFGGELLDFDVAPIITENRTLLPLRKIFEAFNAEVTFIDETRTVKAEKDGFSLELVIGSKTAIVNGETKTLDVPAQIINNRTLVPVRFISESLGAEVDWDGDNRVVSILTETPSGNADYAATKTQLDSAMAVLPIDGAFTEPYLMPSTEGMTLIVFKDIKSLELFNALSAADKSKFVSDTVYENFALVIGCEPVHAKVIYDGNAYYEGEFYYGNRDKLPLTYYEKGKPVNVVKQYKGADNYKDFYLLPASEQTTSTFEPSTSSPSAPSSASAAYTVVSAPGQPTLLVSTNGNWTITMPANWNETTNIPGTYVVENQNVRGIMHVQINQVSAEFQPWLKAFVDASLVERVAESSDEMKISIFENVRSETINGMTYYKFGLLAESLVGAKVYQFSYFVMYDDALFEFCYTSVSNKVSTEFTNMVNSFNPTA